jgi:hypothetical protein
MEEVLKDQKGVEMEFYFSFNLCARWDWVAKATPSHGRFTPENETRYPFYMRMGGPQGRSGWLCYNSLTPRFDPWTVQTVAHHYTDYTKLHYTTLHYTTPTLNMIYDRVLNNVSVNKHNVIITQNMFVLISIVVVEKLTGAYLVKKFHEFYRKRSSIPCSR